MNNRLIINIKNVTGFAVGNIFTMKKGFII